MKMQRAIWFGIAMGVGAMCLGCAHAYHSYPPLNAFLTPIARNLRFLTQHMSRVTARRPSVPTGRPGSLPQTRSRTTAIKISFSS